MTLTADTVSAYLLVLYYVTTTSVLKALAERGACFHFHHKVCAPRRATVRRPRRGGNTIELSHPCMLGTTKMIIQDTNKVNTI